MCQLEDLGGSEIHRHMKYKTTFIKQVLRNRASIICERTEQKYNEFASAASQAETFVEVGLQYLSIKLNLL